MFNNKMTHRNMGTHRLVTVRQGRHDNYFHVDVHLFSIKVRRRYNLHVKTACINMCV
jgi:hypothetical protein